MFEREDWTLFRTVEGLQQRAGVAQNRLRRLVIKELDDNALDTETATPDRGPRRDAFAVSDKGSGIDGEPEDIAALFSIRRPMRSSKLLRLPQRGALGNGLRVVAGAVLASGGGLMVATRNRQPRLRPEHDGSTAVLEVQRDRAPGRHPRRNQVRPGHARGPRSLRLGLPGDGRSRRAIYGGKPSPFWYDAAAVPRTSAGERGAAGAGAGLALDGCSGGKAGTIVEAVGLSRITCDEVTREDATRCLWRPVRAPG